MAGSRVCLNKFCKDRSSVPARRKGWRLRSGDLADLCDNCGTLYEQGAFCEAFHSDGDGWRKCQTCGKRVHCGCIVSRNMFVLLDGGGVECLLCAQKKSTMGTNRPWSSTLILSPSSGGLNDLPLKNWSQPTATNTFSGHLRQSPNTWSSTVAAQSNLHKRLSFEFDRHNSIDRSTSNARPPYPERPTTNTLQERSAFSGFRRIAVDGNSRIKVPGFSGFQAEVSIDRPQESGLLTVDDHHVVTRKGVFHGSRLSSCAGIKLEKVPGSRVTSTLQATVPKQETTAAVICVSTCPALLEAKNPAIMSTNQAYHPTPPNSLQKQLSHNPNSQMEAHGESQYQIHNGRPTMETKAKSQLLPQFLPKKTNEELQIISGNSNTVTLLFEKVLSASDAGRIGRLVLPKKCAEAYFPAISLPEGLPLKVQDITGKEWVFQFRFWPNNNSRMYVLEGVTPCLQSLQLQAGDTVTFTRIDPEGKLVMGFRKSSNSQSEQEVHKSENGLSSTSEVNNRNSNQSEVMPSWHCQLKDSCQSPFNQTDGVDCPKMDKPELVQNEKPAAAKFSVLSTKRKCNSVWSKGKRLQIKSEDSIELKLTWEEAQELLRPPPNYCPSIVLIDGHEFEEYEEAPVLGKPTLFTANQDGTSGKVQWAQCEDCSKWRKLPEDALLPSRLTCSDNIWDSNRSSCLSPQEICPELAELQISNYSTSKKSKTKIETGAIEESDGLETLDNNASLGEGDSSLHPSQPTTKHPRHRPGCSCVICVQAPSGTGPKHKQGCCCNVCVMVQRRLHTMMVNKVKKQAAMEAEAAQRKQLQSQQPELLLQEVGGHDASTNKDAPMCTISAYDDALAKEDTDKRKELSPAKARIDLNMQPEREEDTSPPISNIDCFVSHTQNATQ